jgi:hypothetical protein
MTTKMTTTTGGHRRRRRRQWSPGLVPTIGHEVAADGKCDTCLIAHPLMTGYFVRSVIVILDHTE